MLRSLKKLSVCAALAAIAISGGVSLSGCVALSGATGGDHLKYQTALALGNNTMSTDVDSIDEAKQGITKSTWKATVDGKTFSCEANDMGEKAICRPAT